jgi:hypothetical protein
VFEGPVVLETASGYYFARPDRETVWSDR